MTKQSIDKININYSIHGRGDPLVFIHGLGSSLRDWQYQVEFFANQFRVLTFDLRGHGDSDKPPGPYTMKQFSDETGALISSLGMAPAHVAGISLGGMIAMQLALDAPKVVKSLVVVNAGPDMIVRTFNQRLQLWQRFLLVRLFGMRKVGEVLGSRIFPDPNQQELRQIFIERWAENDPKAWQASLKALVGWSVIDHLEEITCPVLVVSADQDYTPITEKQSYVAKFPNAQLMIIENSHHATPVDQPERFNQVLLDFYQKLRT